MHDELAEVTSTKLLMLQCTVWFL